MSEYLNLDRETALKSVGKGWSGIINNLYDKKPDDLRVLQVKEKYGTLRFYTEYYDEDFEKLVMDAEEESSHICEQCGKEGSTRFDRSWYLTLCDICYVESLR